MFTILDSKMQAQLPIRGVLFDMDGLVLDTEKLYSRFWMEACRAFGYHMTPAESLTMRGLGGQAGEDMLHRYFGEDADYYSLRNKRIELMEQYVDENGVELKPGIRELLDYLDEMGIKKAITSSSPIPRIRKYLGQHALTERFDALCSGRDVPHGKPAPDIYLSGADALDLPANCCLALEDAPAGIISARQACALPVLIPDLDLPDARIQSQCFALCDSLSDVIPLIGKLNK